MLISDHAIEPFIEKHPFIQDKTLIHCSGCLQTPLAFSAHPLSTFGYHLYTLETYKKIAFITETKQPPLTQLLPGLPNASYPVDPHAKPFYHALCVLSGNFTTLLWQKMFNELEATFSIPKQAAYPYLQQITKNLIDNPDSALTGPLARGDHKTIAQNLKALEDDPFQAVYLAFKQAYSTLQTKEEI